LLIPDIIDRRVVVVSAARALLRRLSALTG